jgi:hypothetical protein
VTDFGLHELRNSSDAFASEYEEEGPYLHKFLWTAPELLRDDKLTIKGTQKGDVYAFGQFMGSSINDVIKSWSILDSHTLTFSRLLVISLSV